MFEINDNVPMISGSDMEYTRKNAKNIKCSNEIMRFISLK